MRGPALLGLLLVLGISAMCVRLGFWQLSRLEEKRELNRRRLAALEAPVLDLSSAAAFSGAVVGRRLRLSGVYDSLHHVLLRGRAHQGAPGVEVITPLRLAGRDDAVLVRRGWLPAPDATTARPQDYAERGRVSVVGIAEEARPVLGRVRVVVSRPGEGVTLLSVGQVALDSLRAQLPYPLVGFTLRQLPDPSLPPLPVRVAPAPLNEGMHLSYAVQWFSFALIILVGAVVLALRGRCDAT